MKPNLKNNEKSESPGGKSASIAVTNFKDQEVKSN